MSKKPYLSIARVSIETVSPLLIATGQANDGFDANIIRDANHLPMIPGTSIAGVLRHLATAQTELISLFGDAEQKSELRVSAAVVHNSQDDVNEGLMIHAEKDELFGLLINDEPFSRDRVALNIRGVSVDKGKYDFVAVPAGIRFTFELALQTEDCHNKDDNNRWHQLLNLLFSPQFRLGQKTRSGLGQLKIIHCYQLSLNLLNQDEQKIFADLSKKLGNKVGMTEYSVKDKRNSQQQVESYTLKVQAENGLRIGQGRVQFDQSQAKAKSLIWSETRVVWQDGENGQKAEIKYHCIVIPASGIKGAILHRTLFHYHRLEKNFIQENADDIVRQAGATKLPEALQKLFGVIADENKEQGLAGKLFIDDIVLDREKCRFMVYQHNSIDRFTQATRDKVLFAEEVLWKPTFDIHLRVEQTKQIPKTATRALQCALDDMVNGQLAIGAGSSKGHGYLTGECIHVS